MMGFFATYGARAVLWCFVVAVLAGCTPKNTGELRFDLPDKDICVDVAVLPQDLSVYAQRAGENTVLLDPDRQDRESERFKRRFFAPWNAGVGCSSEKDVFEALAALNPAKGFAENLRPWTQERWRDVALNCNRDMYGAHPVRRAITVRTTHLRRLPTDLPFFRYPGKAGEGFPFDYLQNSTLWLGAPVAVVHVSRDRLWAYVQTRFVSGWAKVADIAMVDAEFVEAWKDQPLVAAIRDNVALHGAKGAADAAGFDKAWNASVGTLLPAAPNSRQKNSIRLLYAPTREADGSAGIDLAAAPVEFVRDFPLVLTPRGVARVGDAMMGQPYGWGGLYGQRDCSAAMRDLFTPFGIWLPRNSRLQNGTGTVVNVEGASPDVKEETIMREGVPFFSLIGMPGHVGLYLGAYPDPQGSGKNVPAMFHNIWGLRVKRVENGVQSDGRAVIGKAVVTSLRPGVERSDIASPASLLDRITRIALLPEKE